MHRLLEHGVDIDVASSEAPSRTESLMAVRASSALWPLLFV
jgi:hypothetical protein